MKSLDIRRCYHLHHTVMWYIIDIISVMSCKKAGVLGDAVRVTQQGHLTFSEEKKQ